MASLRALARSLGVSPATVSRVLAGRPHVHHRMRARVLAAAAAAGLAAPGAGEPAGRRLVALVSDRWPSGATSLSDLLEGAAQGARQAGATLQVATVVGEPSSLSELEAVRRLRPSALLLCFWNDATAAAALASELPTVVVGQPPPEASPVRYATFDAGQGVQQLLEHLQGLGHRRIAFLRDRTIGWRGAERLGAALAAALHAGFALRTVQVDGGRGWSAVRAAIRAGVSGWICDAQSTGQAMLLRCGAWGVRVPRDLSVCSFSFNQTGSSGHRLTSMRGDWRAVGRVAARWALTRPDRLDPGIRLLVHSRVEPGDTTARCSRRPKV